MPNLIWFEWILLTFYLMKFIWWLKTVLWLVSSDCLRSMIFLWPVFLFLAIRSARRQRRTRYTRTLYLSFSSKTTSTFSELRANTRSNGLCLLLFLEIWVWRSLVYCNRHSADILPLGDVFSLWWLLTMLLYISYLLSLVKFWKWWCLSNQLVFDLTACNHFKVMNFVELLFWLNFIWWICNLFGNIWCSQQSVLFVFVWKLFMRKIR